MQPTFFINYGGGPYFSWSRVGCATPWRELEAYLRGFMATLHQRPRAILIVSGEAGTVNFRGNALGKPISGFRFGRTIFKEYYP